MSSDDILVNKNILCGNKECGPRSWSWDIPLVIKMKQHHLLNYAVLILNRPITQSETFMKQFWNNASVRATVDGGTNKWDQYLETLSPASQELMKLPDIVCGDFDSITKECLQKYKQKGCKTVHTPDQNHTDFTKSLIEVQQFSRENHIELHHVIAFSQNSGRLDQTLGNIQTLFLVKDKNLLSSNTKVYLMSDDSISWLLVPGDHCIIIPEETRKHKHAWCALVPLGEACESITTTGLKWNLDKQPLRFGELVSTSNTFDGSETVTVTCSHTVLWSMRVPSVGINLYYGQVCDGLDGRLSSYKLKDVHCWTKASPKDIHNNRSCAARIQRLVKFAVEGL